MLLKTQAENHAENTYTQNHWQFNKLLLELILSVSLLTFVSQFLLRCLCSCIWQSALLKCVRAMFVLLLYACTWYYVPQILLKCYQLNEQNWWKSQNEPFVTNESYLNAAVAWIIWLPMYPLMTLFFFIYIPGLLLYSLVLYFKGNFEILTVRVKRRLKISWIYRKIYLYFWIEGKPGMAIL